MDVDEYDRIDLRFFYQLNNKGQLALLNWCMKMRLIPSSYKCPKCGRNMKITARGVADGYSWICRVGGVNGHHVKRSMRSFSWFNDRHLSILNILLITYLWIKKAGHVFITDELTITFTTINEWFNCCRQICVEICLLESDMLGGEGMTVEIHEIQFKHGKNLPFKGENGKWLVMGIEKDSKKYFLKVCKNKNKETLLEVLKDWIVPGSTIISDVWKNFSCLNDKKFKQYRISQNLTFEHPSKKFKSENIFIVVRNMMRGSDSNEIFILRLAEYLWRRSHNDNSRSLVKSFFKNLSRIYPPHACDYVD